MKINQSKFLAATLIASATLGSATVDAQSPSDSAKDLPAITDERPDSTRGWVVVTKSSYWPLCYESLDRLNEARALIGKAQPEELANALDKSAAWLDLAASAAVIDQRSGVDSVAMCCYDAAEAVRSGSGEWSDAKLNDLIVLAELSMAKSHALRAQMADEQSRPERNPTRTAATSQIVRQANKEIEAAKRERAIEQYKYDTREAIRHLRVAAVYYNAAREASGSDELKEWSREVPELAADASTSQMVDFVDEEVRPRVTQLITLVDSQRKKLLARIDN